MTTQEIAGITARVINVIHHSADGSRSVPGAVIADRLVSFEGSRITYTQGLATVTDSQGTTQWYKDSYNISSHIQTWLDQQGYTWPLSKDQHTHFTLAFI